LLSPWILPSLQAGTLCLPLSPHRPLQWIAATDIGTFAARILEQPEAFIGRHLDLAGDELAPAEAARVLTDRVGRDVAYQQTRLTDDDSSDAARMWRYLESVGYSADIEGLRRDYPETGWHLLVEWLRTLDPSVFNRPGPFAAEALQTGEVS
ncbi:MAG: NmrA family NAD(P)-binding protein, partial [Deltaproteobacteria bacterium]|nr:NmrA family NAD(P)-binding protein [Deltaproteobacteria bacterium]